jgi:hypothetical protein
VSFVVHQTLPVHLSLPLYKHVLGLPQTFSDLQFVDPDLHRSLTCVTWRHLALVTGLVTCHTACHLPLASSYCVSAHGSLMYGSPRHPPPIDPG